MEVLNATHFSNASDLENGSFFSSVVSVVSDIQVKM
jgi:hypothetical protein